jgi:hypothetical protein
MCSLIDCRNTTGRIPLWCWFRPPAVFFYHEDSDIALPLSRRLSGAQHSDHYLIQRRSVRAISRETRTDAQIQADLLAELTWDKRVLPTRSASQSKTVL